MPENFDERLAIAALRLEQEAAVRSPAGVRARGDQRRRRHAATMAVTPVAVLAIAGTVGLTLRPSAGSPGHEVGSRPTISATPTVSAPTTPGPKAAAAPRVTVDLAGHTMVVRDAQGKIVKTLKITAGMPANPTKLGTFTVAGKEPSVTIYSATATENYSLRVYSYIDLGPNVHIYGMPWRSDIGAHNTTDGDIGLNPDDAAWLYKELAIGDTVKIMAGPAQ